MSQEGREHSEEAIRELERVLGEKIKVGYDDSGLLLGVSPTMMRGDFDEQNVLRYDGRPPGSLDGFLYDIGLRISDAFEEARDFVLPKAMYVLRGMGKRSKMVGKLVQKIEPFYEKLDLE